LAGRGAVANVSGTVRLGRPFAPRAKRPPGFLPRTWSSEGIHQKGVPQARVPIR